MFQAMSRVKLDRNRLDEYLAAVYPDSTEPDKQLLVQRDRGWSEFFFDQGKGNRLAGVEGTLWAGSMASRNGLITARPAERKSTAQLGVVWRIGARQVTGIRVAWIKWPGGIDRAPASAPGIHQECREWLAESFKSFVRFSLAISGSHRIIIPAGSSECFGDSFCGAMSRCLRHFVHDLLELGQPGGRNDDGGTPASHLLGDAEETTARIFFQGENEMFPLNLHFGDLERIFAERRTRLAGLGVTVTLTLKRPPAVGRRTFIGNHKNIWFSPPAVILPNPV